MKKQLLAGALALAPALVLAMGMTTSAMASSHDSFQGGRGFHSSRYEGVRGFRGWRHDDWSYRRFGGYGAGVGQSTYCPAFSRCGAGLPN